VSRLDPAPVQKIDLVPQDRERIGHDLWGQSNLRQIGGMAECRPRVGLMPTE
jgi:hypothetical protein